MGLSSILRMLQPKDKVFFTLFEKVADNLVEMSEYFGRVLNKYDVADENFMKQMHEYEHINDEYTHQTLRELSQNFITPFDREDIHHLATSLDDVADFMYLAAKYMYLYKVSFNEAFVDMANHTENAMKHLHTALYGLRNYDKKKKEIFQACLDVNTIENEVDDIYTEKLATLLESKKEVIEIIKEKEILENMEGVIDMCEQAANAIESILVKYS